MELVIYAVIMGFKRLRNRQSGSPRYRLYLDNYTALLTENDAQVNYSIEEMVGKRLEIHLREGRVYRVNLVDND